jgi:hypothetical protein
MLFRIPQIPSSCTTLSTHPAPPGRDTPNGARSYHTIAPAPHLCTALHLRTTPHFCKCPAPLHVSRTPACVPHPCMCPAPLHVSRTSALHRTSAPAPHLYTCPAPMHCTIPHAFAPVCTFAPDLYHSTPCILSLLLHTLFPAPFHLLRIAQLLIHTSLPHSVCSPTPFIPALHYPVPFSPAINTGSAPSHTCSVPVPVPVPCNTILAPHRGHATDVSWTLVLIVMDTTTQHMELQEVYSQQV